MTGSDAAFIVGALFGFGILLLIVDRAFRVYDAWRDRRDRMIRDRNMRRWGFVTYEKSAKERRL